MSPIPIVLDCDPGRDDALTIIFAAFDPRIELLAITTVAGNGPIGKVTENALKICALAGIEGESALDGAEIPSPTFAISDSRHWAHQHCNLHPRLSRVAREY